MGPVCVCVCSLLFAGSGGLASRAVFGAPQLFFGRFVLLLCLALSFSYLGNCFLSALLIIGADQESRGAHPRTGSPGARSKHPGLCILVRVLICSFL